MMFHLQELVRQLCVANRFKLTSITKLQQTRCQCSAPVLSLTREYAYGQHRYFFCLQCQRIEIAERKTDESSTIKELTHY